jgi:hypothetical protein
MTTGERSTHAGISPAQRVGARSEISANCKSSGHVTLRSCFICITTSNHDLSAVESSATVQEPENAPHFDSEAYSGEGRTISGGVLVGVLPPFQNIDQECSEYPSSYQYTHAEGEKPCLLLLSYSFARSIDVFTDLPRPRICNISLVLAMSTLAATSRILHQLSCTRANGGAYANSALVTTPLRSHAAQRLSTSNTN